MVDAGASLAPYAVTSPRGRGQRRGESKEGVSLLHVIHQSLEHVHLIKRFFMVADAGHKMRAAAAEEQEQGHGQQQQPPNPVTLKDIFQLLAPQPAMNRVKDWQGDFYHVVYKSLWNTSSVFRG